MASPDPQAVAIGAAVRAALAQANVTQAAAAVQTGIALNSFSRRINGHYPFTWPELVKVARVARIPVSELAADAERFASRTGVPA